MTAFDIGPWDVGLVLAVSVHATVMAYVHNPRWKALVYGLPVPLTLAVLALGSPVGVTHVLGVALMVLFIHGVRWLYVLAHVPIALSIAGGAVSYCLIGGTVARWVPDTAPAFWAALAGVLGLGLFLYARVPHREQPGHRSPLPVPVKLLVVACVITGLVLIKRYLQGFMTAFPMVGVVGAYEARHSLWTLSRQVSVLVVALVSLLAVCRLTQARLGMLPALGLGWLAFLAVLIPLTLRMWRRAHA